MNCYKITQLNLQISHIKNSIISITKIIDKTQQIKKSNK